MSGWSGDISAMGRLAENIGKLAAVPSRVSERVAQEIAAHIDQQFQAQADPYGNAWAAHEESTIERWGSHPILDLTGTMRGSVEVRPMRGAGVSLTIDHPAAPHQTGWSGPQGAGPARPVLPSKGMPPLWEESIRAAIDEEIKGVLAA